MKLLSLCLAILLAAGSLSYGAEKQDSNQDESAIRQTILSYVEAFNRADAEGLAAHWTKDGDYVDTAGEVFSGQDKLKEAFKTFFQQNKDVSLEVQPLAIYVESPDKAIEEGVAVTKRPDGDAESSRYVASYVKQDGKWKISKIREILSTDDAPDGDKLEPLAWMIGDWVDADHTGKLETSYYWSASKSFIVSSFSMSVAGVTTFGGKQVIGWDPSTNQIRSWVFDSNGSFGEGTWSKRDNSWYVNSTLTLNNGEKASAITILTPVDENSYTWESTNREVGGLPLPKMPKITVVRKPTDSDPENSGAK